VEKLRFADSLHKRPVPSGIDVLTRLEHFSIITYAVAPEVFIPLLIPPRFQLLTVEIEGREVALVSAVQFIDVDFTSAVYPFPKFNCGQTDYRIYVIDQETHERVVWSLGTVIDSWLGIIPQLLWRMPWHSGRVTFEGQQDNGFYSRYEMRTASSWAPAEVQLEEMPVLNREYAGFPDDETALVCLTRPLAGFYYRTDRKLGSYRVWHDRLEVRQARCIHARFGLLDRLGIVPCAAQDKPHSVLIQPINEFTIYLPPSVVPNKMHKPAT
jgi:hypothetical protein